MLRMMMNKKKRHHQRRESRNSYMVYLLEKYDFMSKIYDTGVDNKKYVGKKLSATSVAAVSKANKLDEFVAREEDYVKMRLEIQQQFK